MKKIYIGKSKIHGRGIFADEVIRKGERIQIIKGPVVYKVPRSAHDSRIIGDWVGVGKNLWIKPEKPFLFLNHSCEPSAAVAGKRLLVALKHIRKDEEITMDYSLTDADLHWKIRCHCGAKHCRRYVLPIQKLSLRMFKKYMPNIPRYFQRVYFRAHPQDR